MRNLGPIPERYGQRAGKVKARGARSDNFLFFLIIAACIWGYMMV